MVRAVKTSIIIICNILLLLIIFKIINYVDLYNKRMELINYQKRYDELVLTIDKYKTVLVNYEIMNADDDNDDDLIKKYSDKISKLEIEIKDYDAKIKELDKKIQNS